MPPTAASIADTADWPWRNSATYMVIWPSVMRRAHGGDGDPGVGAVERRGADEAEGEAPGVAPHGERAILRVQAAEDVAVALEQPRPEAEELDLLGVVLARDARSRGRSACASRASASGTGETHRRRTSPRRRTPAVRRSSSTATAHGEKRASSTRVAHQRDARSAPARRCASRGSAAGWRPRGARASACRRTPSPRSAAARGSAPSRGSSR